MHKIHIYIRDCYKQTLNIKICPNNTIKELEKIITEQIKIPSHKLLLYNDGYLDNNKTVKQCEICRNSTIYLFVSP